MARGLRDHVQRRESVPQDGIRLPVEGAGRRYHRLRAPAPRFTAWLRADDAATPRHRSARRSQRRQELFPPRGSAERSFRKAVELHPRDAEAWLGLAASYDRLRRFDLADRAYAQATRIVGATPEILNNQGFSYMLRGDYRRARATLLAAQAKDPANPYIQNNLRMLEESARKAKAIN
jgi:tetratricopeptide (TPR) repeat protein